MESDLSGVKEEKVVEVLGFLVRKSGGGRVPFPMDKLLQSTSFGFVIIDVLESNLSIIHVNLVLEMVTG